MTTTTRTAAPPPPPSRLRCAGARCPCDARRTLPGRRQPRRRGSGRARSSSSPAVPGALPSSPVAPAAPWCERDAPGTAAAHRRSSRRRHDLTSSAARTRPKPTDELLRLDLARRQVVLRRDVRGAARRGRRRHARRLGLPGRRLDRREVRDRGAEVHAARYDRPARPAARRRPLRGGGAPPPYPLHRGRPHRRRGSRDSSSPSTSTPAP